MTTKAHRPPNEPAGERIEQLEAELSQIQRRLEAKERELREIHQSKAWGLLSTARSLKYRYLDPALGLFGITWPRRRALLTQEVQSSTPRAASPSRHDVLCLSICDWDSRFQRPQQLMSLFGAAGHRVFYVRQQFRADGPPWTMIEKAPNVYEVTLRGQALEVHSDRLSGRACDLLFDGVEVLRRDLSLSSVVTMVQIPFWWPLARRMRDRFDWPVVYDCMDFHAGFSTVRHVMLGEERQMLSGADVVTVSSTRLEEHARAFRDDVVMVRNGCDYDHFARTPRAFNARPVIGYYGAISDWFDSGLVASLAGKNPEWDFILVGSTYNGDLSRLKNLPNVSLPGEEPYETLPEWLGRFDVTILPFRRTRLTEATNPVKLYEILASGKPLVSVPLPEVAAVGPWVRLAANAEEFQREIAAALAEDGSAAEQRRAFAREHTWARRFETMSAAINTALANG